MGRTRRKKKHSQKASGPDEAEGGKKVPKAFVIERGKVGHVLSQLVLDLRRIMEPHTATKLKVQHKNVLKDFVAMAGPLGVTHLIMVSRTSDFVNLKVCVLPRGPTLTFHIKAFSLAREVLSSLKTPVINPAHFLTPPVLALNNFADQQKCNHLMSTVFQNMLPSINVHTVSLANIRRCLLMNSDPETKLIELRHYAVRVVPRGVSRGVKKLSRAHLPDLGKFSDISEYLLNSGYGSESDGEELAGEGAVTLPQHLLTSAKSDQNTVKLSELGPRLTLQLVKIESGLCGGEVLHHTFVHKSKKEKRLLQVVKERERRLRESRRREQEANVARKRAEREEHKARCLAGMAAEGEGEGLSEGEEEEDREWYRKEVGVEPDPDLFGSGTGVKVKGCRKRSLSSHSVPKSKKPRHSETTPTQATPPARRTQRRALIKDKGQRSKAKGPLQKRTQRSKAKLPGIRQKTGVKRKVINFKMMKNRTKGQ